LISLRLIRADVKPYPGQIVKAVSCLCGSLLLLSFGLSAAPTKARPPKPADVVGVWIGFTEDELDFYRLDLRRDFTGYCASVSPPDTVLHEQGVDTYRINSWWLNGWALDIKLVPLGTKAEAIFLRGRYDGFTLQLEVGGTDGSWKRRLVLRPEPRTAAPNRETKQAIDEAERK
jgi:hypothetical protein